MRPLKTERAHFDCGVSERLTMNKELFDSEKHHPLQSCRSVLFSRSRQKRFASAGS